MNFPRNIEDLKANLQAAIRSRNQAVTSLKNQISEVENQINQFQTMLTVLQRLADSWRDNDPGKYDDAYFFLNGEDRVVVEEFLPEDAKTCGSKEEWVKYLNSREYRGKPYEVIPFGMRIMPISEVLCHPCPACSEEVPLVEHYVQAYDGPSGDLWVKELLALCAQCQKVFVVDKKSSRSRFFI